MPYFYIIYMIYILSPFHFADCSYYECTKESDCDDKICGTVKCTKCSSIWTDIPANICYSLYDPNNFINCERNSNCKSWEMCMHHFSIGSDSICTPTYPGGSRGTNTNTNTNTNTIRPYDIEKAHTHPEKAAIDASSPTISPSLSPVTNILNEENSLVFNTPAVNYDECLNKKKIIVDVDKSGFGNRMTALTSAIMLSVITDRVLFLKWTPDITKCGARFDQIFMYNEYLSSNQEVFYLLNESISNQNNVPTLTTEIECSLRLDQSFMYLDIYYFLKRDWLLSKLNKKCDVIYIHGNRYFGSILYELNNEELVKKLNNTLTNNPYEHLGKTKFKINNIIDQSARRIVDEMHSYGPFLSLHIRSYYSKIDQIEVAFKCVNSLLDLGIIKKVFLATDSYEYENLAKKLVNPSDAIVTMVKELEKRTSSSEHNPYHLPDSTDLRDHMYDAMKEYMTLNHADYCGSVSIEFSTFAQASLNSGPCKFIDLLKGDQCASSISSFKPPFFHLVSPYPEKLKPSLSRAQESKIWEYFSKTNIKETKHRYPCMKKDNIYEIEDFWKSQS